MSLSDSYTRRVLHLAYILEADFDPYSRDTSTIQTKQEKWENDKIDAHRNLLFDIERELHKICDNIAGNVYRYIRRNGIDDAEIMQICNEIDNSKDAELVTENKVKFIQLLKLIERKGSVINISCKKPEH